MEVRQWKRQVNIPIPICMFGTWLSEVDRPMRLRGFPMKEIGTYPAWRERMMKRPAVKKWVEDERKVSTS